MNTMSVIMLLLGIAIFIASFVVPEKRKKATEADKKLSEELVKETVETEMQLAKNQIQDSVDETVSYSMEKTERIMERLSNEKIQAVNDYSDTVLEEIHKNHKEILFLYDMLNDKQKNLNDTVKSVNDAITSAEETIKKVEESVKNVDKVDALEKPKTTRKASVKVAKTSEKDNINTKSEESVSVAKPKKTTRKKADSNSNDMDTLQFSPLQAEKVEGSKAINDIDIVVGENGKNNNEMILQMHKSGKSNMAIAKELGLGVGEVKLVIDLFENM